jgi:hypothetical protein
MDHSPGPISARVTPSTANAAGIPAWAGDEKDAGQYPDHLRRRNRATGCRCRAVEQNSADQQPLNQKPGARRAAREGGEQPLHKNPVFSLKEWHRS